jgi:hypothetical protein
MTEINHPVLSRSKIIKAVFIALIIGLVLLVCAILPAEYGIDPTGIGKITGFGRLYVPENTTINANLPTRSTYPLIKMEKAGSGPEVKRPIEADNPPPEKQDDVREDSVQVTVPAGKGIEFKTYMLKYGKMKYEWTTADNTVLYFDFHGEVNQEITPKDVYFESYTIAYSNNMVGTFLAPFEGKHGWFFRNKSDKDVIVNIRLKGQYSL